MKRSKDGSRHVTDEIFNTALHSAASFFSLLGGVVLVAKAAMAGDLWKVVSFSVYMLTLVLLYVSSSLHHGLKCGKKCEAFLRSLDYGAIFLLIAGTLTPLSLVVLRGTVIGWTVFGICWIFALAGFVVMICVTGIPKWFTTTIFIAMGWSSLFLFFPLYRRIGFYPMFLIAAGGIVYTAGSLVFSFEKPNPVPGKFGFHEIWHIFVMTGSLLHYMAVYLFILPYQA